MEVKKNYLYIHTDHEIDFYIKRKQKSGKKDPRITSSIQILIGRLFGTINALKIEREKKSIRHYIRVFIGQLGQLLHISIHHTKVEKKREPDFLYLDPKKLSAWIPYLQPTPHESKSNYRKRLVQEFARVVGVDTFIGKVDTLIESRPDRMTKEGESALQTQKYEKEFYTQYNIIPEKIRPSILSGEEKKSVMQIQE